MAAQFINHLPDTPFGATLNLTAEQEDKCRVVYRLSEEDPDIYVFDSLWDPQLEYSDQCIIVPLRSTGVNVVSKNAGFEFANIVDSSDDPHPLPKSWIQLLISNGISCDTCATDGCFYNPADNTGFTYTKSGSVAACSTGMVGGHVCEGKVNHKYKSSDHVNVLLIPICSHHNSCSCGTGGGNGQGFYMKLRNTQNVLELVDYMNKMDVCKNQ